jgi:hypothetical protein
MVKELTYEQENYIIESGIERDRDRKKCCYNNKRVIKNE